MAKKDIEIPEIDDAGSPQSLGELRNRAILGEKVYEEGDEEGFSKLDKKIRENKEPITTGWVMVDRTEMGSRSQFYPGHWQFYIKPAPVMSVKNWSSVDDTRPEQVNQVMNEIIRTSVKVDTGDGGTWGLINSWDRFWFILKVREATMMRGESRIEFEDRCSECECDIHYTLNSSSLHFDLPDGEIIEKHWDGYKWTINPEDYGVEGPVIELYNPTLGRDNVIIEWAQSQAQNKNHKKLDETFLKFYVWMLPKVPRDVTSLDKHLEQTRKKYEKWDLDYHRFVEEVIKNIAVIPGETLRAKCPNCGGEATSEVRFPNGIKNLWTVKEQKKFGSR